jgi:hypothetical protein
MPADLKTACGHVIGTFQAVLGSGCLGVLGSILLLLAITAVAWLGTADLEGATHEFLAAELDDGTASFLDGGHGHEGKAFGTLRAAVNDDFGVTDVAHAVEELKEITLGGVVREIADVKTLGGDFSGIRRGEFADRLGLTRWAWGLAATAAAAVGTG